MPNPNSEILDIRGGVSPIMPARIAAWPSRIGHGFRTLVARYLACAPTPFRREDCLELATQPRNVLARRAPQLLAEFERAFREAGLPLSLTNAARPRARIKFAANLPVGVELRGEVLEVYFDELVALDRIQAAGELLPEGVEIVDAREVWHGFPSA